MFLNKKIKALILCALPMLAQAELPDYSKPGPMKVVSGEYRLPATVDPLVTSDRVTEVWGVVFRPAITPKKPWPLVVFLHGNHGTCGRFDNVLGIRIDDDTTYTTTGTCPAGYVVTPNHRGYDYLAERLASWGYVVVSINANRGITADFGPNEDPGLNLRRGRMVLRHLALLSQWNKNELPTPSSLPFTLAKTMDFSEVGLMGHSRGGEGMLAAWRQYRDDGSPFRAEIHAPLTVRSIFEIAPVDGQTFRELNAEDVSSMILLSNCDGDVSDLEGVHVFDRALLGFADTGLFPPPRITSRGTFNVLGGNHNFYNTEWQQSDGFSCPGHPPLYPETGGSPAQRLAALNTLIPFFRGTVGRQHQASHLTVFNPRTPFSGPLTTIGGLERGFVFSSSYNDRWVLESFNAKRPVSEVGFPHVTRGVSVRHQAAPPEHDSRLRVARIDWPIGTGSETPYIDIALASTDFPRDLSQFRYLGLRLATTCHLGSCGQDWADTPSLDASLTVFDVDGHESSPAIALKDLVDLRRPVGGGGFIWDSPAIHFPSLPMHSILQHAYLPVSALQGVDPTRIITLRLTFDRSRSGRLLLDEITGQNDPLGLPVSTTPLPLAQQQPAAASLLPSDMSADSGAVVSDSLQSAQDHNLILSVNRRNATPSQAGKSRSGENRVDVVLGSARSFPVTNSLPKALLGNAQALYVRRSTDGNQLVATFNAQDFDQQTADAPFVVRIGSHPLWHFGKKPNG